MDPVTQGVLGATLAQAGSQNQTLAKAAVIGALAGMAPDLDSLIRSASDPLLYLEFHRQFTHALLFIPLGGLLVSWLLHPLLGKRWGLGYRQTLLWCILGVATHGLLDGCTSYGTQLLWPVSNQRIAWDIISIIDPLFTLPLLLLVVFAAKRKRARFVYAALLWGSCYLTFGFVQHQRVIDAGQQLAAQRGHQVLRLHAKPSFANLAVWKVVYETENGFHVDAIKPGLPGTTQPIIWPGAQVRKLDIARDLPWLDPDSQQARDIERFRWFSDGHIALDAAHPERVVDIRYSLLPQEIKPLWGIELAKDAQPTQHANYYTERANSGAATKQLLHMVFE